MFTFFITTCVFSLAFLIRHWLCSKFSDAYKFHSSLFVVTCSAAGVSSSKIFYSSLFTSAAFLALFPLYISIPLFVISEAYTLSKSLKNPSRIFVSVP